MKVERTFPIILLIILVPVYLYTLTNLTQLSKNLPKGGDLTPILPSPILKITSLEFDGLSSDILYLKGLTFYGSTIGNQQRKVKESEFNWLYGALNASTDLDPYFLDPYMFANGILTWEAHKIRETNELLKKGSRYREWDYWLPFYIGFNYFYFLGENEKASEYLMEASRKPGASPLYGHLAARLAYQSNRTENAIIFLESMLDKIEDKTMRQDYVIRLKTLKAILQLEKGVKAFQEKTGKKATSLSDLLKERVIAWIPLDPYGGEFYIDEKGDVKTTSNLVPMRKGEK